VLCVMTQPQQLQERANTARADVRQSIVILFNLS
jgi:hypothetical protein